MPIIIYTIITGNYDTFKQPLVVEEDVLFLGGGHNYESLDIPMGKQGTKPSTPVV